MEHNSQYIQVERYNFVSFAATTFCEKKNGNHFFVFSSKRTVIEEYYYKNLDLTEKHAQDAILKILL